MAEPLRPLTTGELLDRTFSLYSRNFLMFVMIAALAPVEISPSNEEFTLGPKNRPMIVKTARLRKVAWLVRSHLCRCFHELSQPIKFL